MTLGMAVSFGKRRKKLLIGKGMQYGWLVAQVGASVNDA